MKRKKLIAALSALACMQSAAYANVSYTVQKGDTYWLIAGKFGISLSSLMSANSETSSYLDTGSIITVPSTKYTVQKGDTYWLIAKKCNVSLNKLLEANSREASSTLYEGDILSIPSSESDPNSHTAVKGDTYWTISQKYNVSLSSLLALNNANEGSILYVGDTVLIPSSEKKETNDDSAYVTYEKYIVKDSDTLWSIAIDNGIPFSELLEANSLSESSYIYEGQKITIPVHHIPIKSTPSAKFGELLDWFSEAQYVIPIGADFKLIDFETGKSFNARRTVGSGHADCEPLTSGDTSVMKEIWGGNFSWNKRSVIIEINGRHIAASASAMPHAGNEWAAAGVWTDWRSDNYGAGINYDYIKGNDASGHFDLYFYNSIGHSKPVTNEAHQANVLKSAGMN